jgi:uncharacterized membrane protein
MTGSFDTPVAPKLPDLAGSGLARAGFRLRSIDSVRGLAIVIMALDHVRAYFTSVRFDALDLSQTTAALFLTRWITHLCAPTFLVLAGVSAYLVSRRSQPGHLRRFLITRGLWLILLEITVVQFAWHFNVRYDTGLFAQVIWAIGASLIVLAALVRLPPWTIGAFGLTMIAGHNLLDGVAPESFGRWALAWNLLHVFGRTPIGVVYYPLIPWVGVTALGYYAGTLFELDVRRRRSVLFGAGIASLVLIVLLRAINGYGDPYQWSSQSTVIGTCLSFIKVHKYPPSLLYLLVMLGVASILLALFETTGGKLVDILNTYGRVPLFFYVVHIYVVHLTAGLIALASGYGTTVLTNVFLILPQGWGFGLPGVYLVWALVVAGLYPACRWFADLKQRRTDWWLSYL